MKTLSLLFFTLGVSVQLLAQTRRMTHSDQSLRIAEEYYVLKADKQIKQGKYTAYDYYNLHRVLCRGYYKNNLRDSLWINYGYNNQVIDSGRYHEGKKVGIWTAYSNNKPEIKYDYTKNELLLYKSKAADKKMFTIITGDSTQKVLLDRPPVYLSGTTGFYNSISRNISYPVSARRIGLEGKVMVSFVINADGHPSDYKVKESLSPSVDAEALRVITLLSGDWLPGMYQGKPVAVQYNLPITFGLAN